MKKKSIARICYHGECRQVAATGHLLEIVKCPWCDYQVSTSNPGNWCAKCETMFVVEGGLAHFGKGIEKSVAVHIAQMLSRSGGLKFGGNSFGNNNS